MIYSLSGKIAEKKDGFIVVDVGGLGYKVFMSGNAFQKAGAAGSEIKVLTHMHVREDDMSLFGFLKEDELALFESLISVSGIGPKSAMNIISIAPVERISAAIIGGETELLQKVSGVGKKTAERIVLELKEKIVSGGEGVGEAIKAMEADSDIYEALTSMGYTAKQAKNAISKIGKETKGASERLKEALKIIKT